jgi:hypothetical protein
MFLDLFCPLIPKKSHKGCTNMQSLSLIAQVGPVNDFTMEIILKPVRKIPDIIKAVI